MLDWLKEIIGEAYTDDMGGRISDRIGKDFVARADFNATNEAKKILEQQVKDRDKQLEDLKKLDAEGLQKRITELEAENSAAKDSYTSQIESMKKDWAAEKYFDGFKFTSELAKTAAIQQFREKDLKFEDGKFIGADEFMKELQEKNPTAFENEEDDNKPVVTRPMGKKPKKGEKMTLEEAMIYKNEHPEADINDLI